MAEVWRDLERGPYVVSSEGRIAKLRRPWVGPLGYARCHTINHDGTKVASYAHQVVAEAFLGPCPKNCEIHHVNEDKSDNRAENLEYVTRRDHVLISVENKQHPLGEKHGNSKLTEDDVRDIRLRYAAGGVTYQGLAAERGMQATAIRMLIIRKTWRHVP